MKRTLGLVGTAAVLALVASWTAFPDVRNAITPTALLGKAWNPTQPWKFIGNAGDAQSGRIVVGNDINAGPLLEGEGVIAETRVSAQAAGTSPTGDRPIIELMRAGGSFASKTTPTDGYRLGLLRWGGWHSGQGFTVGSIALLGVVDGAPGSDYIPARLDFIVGTPEVPGGVVAATLDKAGALQRPLSFKSVDYSPVDVVSAPTTVDVPVGSPRLVLRGFSIRTNNSSWRFWICQSKSDPSSCVYGISGGTTGWSGDYSDFEANRFYVDRDGGSNVHVFIDPEGKPEAFRFLLNVEVQ